MVITLLLISIVVPGEPLSVLVLHLFLVIAATAFFVLSHAAISCENV